MTDLSTVRFFVTPLHQCSYLPRRDAVTLFADPKAPLNHQTYSELSLLGFRRSGNYLYRPHCKQCAACIPVRIPVDHFKPSRSQRRNMKMNSDLQILERPPQYTDEYYALYERYIAEKHRGGDMYPTSREQYESFLLSSWGNTRFLEFRQGDELIAVAVTDIMDSGLSAVYTFYDPAQSKRALGVYAILHQIEEAKRMHLPAVYLGYWIKQCQKMNYKTAFQPIEMYINNDWVTQQGQQPDDPEA